MIKIKIKRYNKVFFKKVSGFFIFTIPLLMTSLLFFLKMFSLCLFVIVKQKNINEDNNNMEKIKIGIINYIKERKELPPVNSDGTIDYKSSYISHYIPPTYRKNHKGSFFLVRTCNLQFIHDFNKDRENTWNKEDEDLDVLFSFYNPHDNNCKKIYYGDLENVGCNLLKKEEDFNFKGQVKKNSLDSVLSLFINKKEKS